MPGVVAKKASGDPKKLTPTDKETADHSVHYCVAVALLDGACGHEQFTQERIQSTDIASLIRRIRIEEDAELTRMYPGASGSVVSVRLRDGRELQSRHPLPPGHFGNRVSDTAIERKFIDLSKDMISKDNAQRAAESVWSLEKLENLDALFGHLVVDAPDANQSFVDEGPAS